MTRPQAEAQPDEKSNSALHLNMVALSRAGEDHAGGHDVCAVFGPAKLSEQFGKQFFRMRGLSGIYLDQNHGEPGDRLPRYDSGPSL